MSRQEIPRAEIRVGVKVLAPEWAFGAACDESGDRLFEAEVIRVESLWRRQPRRVRIKTADGRQGIINVSWLRRVKG